MNKCYANLTKRITNNDYDDNDEESSSDDSSDDLPNNGIIGVRCGARGTRRGHYKLPEVNSQPPNSHLKQTAEPNEFHRAGVTFVAMVGYLILFYYILSENNCFYEFTWS